jgi:hypothetical protein
MTRPSQPDLVLAAVLDGASTVGDIADELGVGRKHASVLIWRLLKEGRIRWSGRRMPRDPGIPGSRGQRVYEPVNERKSDEVTG